MHDPRAGCNRERRKINAGDALPVHDLFDLLYCIPSCCFAKPNTIVAVAKIVGANMCELGNDDYVGIVMLSDRCGSQQGHCGLKDDT